MAVYNTQLFVCISRDEILVTDGTRALLYCGKVQLSCGSAVKFCAFKNLPPFVSETATVLECGGEPFLSERHSRLCCAVHSTAATAA